jgi:hypothetical protein
VDVASKVNINPYTLTKESFEEKQAVEAVRQAVKEGVTDPDELTATGEQAAAAAKRAWEDLAASARVRH